MFTENLVKIFTVLEDNEKMSPCFTQEEKQFLYQIAFHEANFAAVDGIVQQAIELKGNRNQFLRSHAARFPLAHSHVAEQLEKYIFQVQLMLFEKEKANHMLEEFLKRCGLEKEVASLTFKARDKPAEPQKGRAAVQAGKSI